jgi:hypothetical protein
MASLEVIMSTTTAARPGNSTELETRVLNEGYGPGAWHGPDLKAALAGVSLELAFWRPAPGRHNIAEIALHHAYYARAVRAKLTGAAAEPFVLDGDDWFPLPNDTRLAWPEILALVDTEHRQLTDALTAIGAERTGSPLPPAERFDLVLGITCHAIYHAGQVQLVKALRAG